MKKLLLINGPNLGRLGRRKRNVYGTFTLSDIENLVAESLASFEIECESFQSEGEKEIIEFIDEHFNSDGMIINPGAFMMHGYALRDALDDYPAPWIEVHISNIFARESFRHQSILAPISAGFISGCGLDGYRLAAHYIGLLINQ